MSMPFAFEFVDAIDEARHVIFMACRRVGARAPQTSATFLPENTSLTVLAVGPSAPITVNFASGNSVT